MGFLWVLLIGILLIDTWVLHRRARGLRVIPLVTEPALAEHVFWTAPNVTLTEGQRRSVSAFMVKNELSVLDLIPESFPAESALDFLRMVDPVKYRTSPFAPGCSALHAIALSPEAGRHAEGTPESLSSPASFAALVLRLKRLAWNDMDLAVMPDQDGRFGPDRLHPEVLRAFLGSLTEPILSLVLCFRLALLLGVILMPAEGGLALVVYHLQPLLVLSGGSLAVRGLLGYSLLRLPWDLCLSVRSLLQAWRSPPAQRWDDVSRQWYQVRLARGAESLFESRETRCPICAEDQLEVLLRAPDLLQGKPGQFTLERCQSCQHIFQNPRLNAAGLEFYYREHVESQGEPAGYLSSVFGQQRGTYRQRARMLQGIHQPKRWLDVGTGAGYFFLEARQIWLDTRFDGLDQAQSVEDGEKSGWIDKAFRGRLSDWVEQMAEQYDVVSMYQYIEHSPAPSAELSLAHRVLAPGGYLIVEVPNPECPVGRWLGRYWMPWYQPQHLHFLSYQNLERLLGELGFETSSSIFGEAHEKIDFQQAVLLLMNHLCPDAQAPWRASPPEWPRARYLLKWSVAPLLFLLAALIDATLAPYLRGERRSNTFRILARKTLDPEEPPVSEDSWIWK